MKQPISLNTLPPEKIPYLCPTKIPMRMELDLSRRYTFADYLTWIDNQRRELFGGFVRLMSPAPSSFHQSIEGSIFREISWYLKRKKYKIFVAPLDVRLPTDGETADDKLYTVVQPDICIICDLSKIDARGCLGAPDMIVEICSPATAKRDVEEKFQLYQQHGVREYWIVFPELRTINVFLLDASGRYQLAGMFANDSKVRVNILEDLEIDLAEIFEE